MPPEPAVDAVQEVFAHWVSVCRSHGRRPVLDDKRRRVIAKAVASHGVDTCKAAIDGCKASAWHQGANPRAKTYDEITLILRDAEHIEGFADTADTPAAVDRFLRGLLG